MIPCIAAVLTRFKTDWAAQLQPDFANLLRYAGSAAWPTCSAMVANFTNPISAIFHTSHGQRVQDDGGCQQSQMPS
jgi:hypothetical protein